MGKLEQAKFYESLACVEEISKRSQYFKINHIQKSMGSGDPPAPCAVSGTSLAWFIIYTFNWR